MFMLEGKLFQIMMQVVFKKIGIIVDDKEHDCYLPNPLTKSTVSMKLDVAMTGLEHPVQARQYMGVKSAMFNLSMLDFKILYVRFKLDTWLKVP